MELHELLKIERKKKGYSLRQLSRETNISQAYLSQLEKGEKQNPSTEKLLAISYALDSQGYDQVFQKLSKTLNLPLDNPKKTFNEYVNKKTYNQDSTKITNKMRISTTDRSIVELDVPSFDIEWLLTQNNYHVFLGKTGDYILGDNGKNISEEIFVLKPEEKYILEKEIKKIKASFIEERKFQNEENDNRKKTEEYDLIFDLLNKQLDGSDDFISRLASINKDREIFNAKEFHEEIEKAVEQQDALKLQRLIRMTTINELKQYLSE
ncbi:XRE family transcriptional regulator [bacterium M00.F.Ca.ET.180.01.1.1]|uniref:helix-turn-helix domain-containing protein n=1 Tax=Staphylococcus cohnii TaxID=29382 RepID=UPI001092CFA6|nr:XRE family transcriptional regulator [bacterium M00.F.Ca.ET.229.01.1.1]TGS38294.1 XRE family transcriptional regulator [bacterium M00.F.Ca.ET.180.01.1.1]